MRGDIASFQFSVQAWPVLGPSGWTVAKRLICKLGVTVIMIVGNHLVMHLAVPLIPRSRGGGGDVILDVLLSTT